MPPDFDHDVACALQGCLQPGGFIVFTVAILAQGTSWAVAATQAFLSNLCYFIRQLQFPLVKKPEIASASAFYARAYD